MQKTALEELYRTHHEARDRYGYLYCHGERLPYLKDWIGTGKKVLDLGCRDGMLTQGYVEGNEVTGVDIDRKALDLAEKKLKIKTAWVDLNTEWPFEKESYDVIIACELLEHLFFLDRFLSSVRLSLKKGGLFIGSVPNAFRVRNRIRFFAGKAIETDPTHVRMFSPSQIQRVLGDFFGVVEMVPLQGKVLPFIPVSPWLPLPIRSLFAKDLLWKAIKKN